MNGRDDYAAATAWRNPTPKEWEERMAAAVTEAMKVFLDTPLDSARAEVYKRMDEYRERWIAGRAVGP